MDILKEYLPDNSVAYIKEILVKYDIEIQRGMKSGDKVVKKGEASAHPDADIQGDLIFVLNELWCLVWRMNFKRKNKFWI